MAKYTVKVRQDVVTENKTFNDPGFGGWMAVNTGTVDITVDNFTLQPGDGIDLTHLQPDVLYTSPIRFQVPAGGQAVLARLLYKEVK